ncbi:hypothetical protein NP493_2776g00018 [Ridgeia piscesae]|uniref:Uncharacterized protein n=1 Tax=Ridgeia piscesae TaxID=27915 RepID=A0AAD9N0F9_RIDPI|nr:hypothetical protein NP493_2776g00018 [Ridgeia piscesae]
MRCHWLLLGAVLLLGAIDVTSSYNVWKLATANGNFAFRLYRKVIKGAAGENVFFSPFRTYNDCVTDLKGEKKTFSPAAPWITSR